VVQDRVRALAADAARYVEAFDERVVFTSRQLRLHQQTIAIRRQAASAKDAIDSADFLVSLRSTLQHGVWGVGVPDWLRNQRSTTPSDRRGHRSRDLTGRSSTIPRSRSMWESESGG
jgi:hypothetical protein